MEGTIGKASDSGALQHAPLRHLLIAWGLSNAALWAWAMTIATVAFQHGGASAVALALAARLIPGAFAAPVATVLAARMPGAGGLTVSTLVRLLAICAGALVLASESALWLLYLAVILEGLGSGPMHALHVRMLPLLSRRPDELGAANSLTELLRGAGLFIGPCLSALVLFLGNAPLAMLLCIAFLAVSLWMLMRPSMKAGSRAMPAMASPFTQIMSGLTATLKNGGMLLLVAISMASGLVMGCLQLLLTGIAIEILEWGSAGPSILLCMVGLGGLAGGGLSLKLANRKALSAPLALGLASIGVGAIALGLAKVAVVVIAACVIGGIGLSVLLVMLNTLLQRTVPLAIQAAVFGLSAFVQFIGIGAGGSVGAVLAGLAGLAQAPVVFGAGLLVLALGAWLLLRTLVPDTHFETREFEILRRSAAFRTLAVGPAMQVASCLQRTAFKTGETVMRQGEPGDDAYLVDSGRLDVLVDGARISRLGPGDVVGEIALLQDVPRTATVVAKEPVELWRLNRDAFLCAVTGTPDCFQTISDAARKRLREIDDLRPGRP